jgi:hypothetical protein
MTAVRGSPREKEMLGIMERACRGTFSAYVRQSAVLLPLVATIALVGCASNEEADRAARSGQPASELRLIVGQEEVALPLEMMDIFLVEEYAYPETFEMRGPGILLVGQFPLDVHVGYEANLEVLRGRDIALQPSGGGSFEPKASVLKLPGRARMAVLGGRFVVEQSTGPREGVKGDGTLSGRISIQVQGESGLTTLEGDFSVPATTWG